MRLARDARRIAPPEIRLARIVSLMGANAESVDRLRTATIRWADASFADGSLTPTNRGSQTVVAAVPASVIVNPGDLVLATFRGGRWWILRSYCRGSYFPFLPAPCSPSDCVEGNYFPDQTCDLNAPAYYFTLGWTPLAECCELSQEMVIYLTPTSGDIYESQTFSCSGETVYWKLTTGASPSLQLLVAADDSIPAIGQILYRKDSAWCCRCSNLLYLSCPASACSQKLSRLMCIRPSNTFDGCALCDSTPFSLAITFDTGFADCDTCYDVPAGTYVADFLSSGPAGAPYTYLCAWAITLPASAPCTDRFEIWLATTAIDPTPVWYFWFFSTLMLNGGFVGSGTWNGCGETATINVAENAVGCDTHPSTINLEPVT